MEKIHSKYVFAPADKAAKQRHHCLKKDTTLYVDVLKEKLNSTSTYLPA